VEETCSRFTCYSTTLLLWRNGFYLFIYGWKWTSAVLSRLTQPYFVLISLSPTALVATWNSCVLYVVYNWMSFGEVITQHLVGIMSVDLWITLFSSQYSITRRYHITARTHRSLLIGKQLQTSSTLQPSPSILVS